MTKEPNEPTPKDRSDLAPSSLEQLAEDIAHLSTGIGKTANTLRAGTYETPITNLDAQVELAAAVVDSSEDNPGETVFLYALDAKLNGESLEELIVVDENGQLTLEVYLGEPSETIDLDALDPQQRKAATDAIITSFYLRYDVKGFLKAVDALG